MSAKLMDATPDLKRLAPVENLAIDVISYAHGSVTPTLTNLYTKGKDSFLKVSKSFFLFFFFLVPFSLFSLLLSFFIVFILSVMVSIISMLLRLVFTHRVYYYGSRLLLEFGSKRAFVANSFFACVWKTDGGRERTVVASSLSSRLYNKKILTITNRNNFTFVNARAIF